MANYTMTLKQINDETLYHWFIKDYPFYVDDEEAKKEFEQKFYDYYFDREIGFETVERYLMKMNGYLKLKMPYYRLMYETILKTKNIEFMLNKDLVETIKHEVKEQERQNQYGTSQVSDNGTSSLESSTSGNNNQSNTGTVTNENSSTSDTKESVIRDGVAQANLENGYLTGVNHGTTNGTQTTTNNLTTATTISQSDSQSGTTSNTSNGQSQTESNNNRQLEETNTLISKGNIGTTSSAQLLRDWRDVLLDMDELIIKDLEFLFMRIY